MPKLIVKHPEKGEMTFPLSGDRITIGRRADNIVQINHGTVSGHHAEFVSINGHYVLRDLDSTNHCFVNGAMVTQADLKEACKVGIGTVECEFVPDPPMAVIAKVTTSSINADADNLRRTVGHLREQNESLILKNSELQKQIDILGTARLIGSSGDTALKAKVQTLTEENARLTSEVNRLRSVLTATSDPTSLKETAPIAIALTPSGATVAAAPVAKVVTPGEPAVFTQLAELHAKLATLTESLAATPDDRSLREHMLSVCTQMSERAATLEGHAATRLISSLETLLRDVAHRPGRIGSGLLTTIKQATELLATVLTPTVFPRCASLPTPSILAVDDDKDLLPAIVAALEFSRLPTKACASTDAALTALRAGSYDLVLVDRGLPDLNGIDAGSAMRKVPGHEKTPILALSGHDSIGRPAPSAIDSIGKPFNMFELTVKAHTWACKHQLGLV